MTAELLQLRKRAGGAPLERCGDAFVLEAEEHLVLEGPKAEIDEIAKTLGSIAERFRDDLLALEFGNAVGVFNLPGLGRVEVHSGKWGPDHFRQMLSDLSIVASALPFRGTATAALPFDRSVLAETDVLYHAFVYLRYAILEGEGDDNLLRSYLFVMQEPHQILVRQDRSVPTELATRVGPRSLLSLVCRGHQLAPAGFARKLPIARALRGYVARRVDEEGPANDSPVTSQWLDGGRRFRVFAVWVVARARRGRATLGRRRGHLQRFSAQTRSDAGTSPLGTCRMGNLRAPLHAKRRVQQRTRQWRVRLGEGAGGKCANMSFLRAGVGSASVPASIRESARILAYVGTYGG